MRTILKGKTALQYRKGKLLTICNERRTFVLISLSQESSDPQALRSSGNHRSGPGEVGPSDPQDIIGARGPQALRKPQVRALESTDTQALRTPQVKALESRDFRALRASRVRAQERAL